MPGRVFTRCSAATMVEGERDYGLVEGAAIAVGDGRIAWVGPQAELPQAYAGFEQVDLGGALVTPALVDCHTHLVFGGDRAREFALRLEGASYEEIARAGGGIRSTVAATRAASDEELLASALRRVDDLLADGVALVEVKSGYGLSIEHELRMLRVARAIEVQRPVRIVTSWLAAHALPPEYEGAADRYIDEVVIPGLEAAAARRSLDLSVAHLSAAAAGRGSAALHAALNALVTGRADDLPAELERIEEIGHTSGWDALAGAVTALRSVTEGPVNRGQAANPA